MVDWWSVMVTPLVAIGNQDTIDDDNFPKYEVRVKLKIIRFEPDRLIIKYNW